MRRQRFCNGIVKMHRFIHILTHEYPPQRGGAGAYCYELGLAASKIFQNIRIWAPHASTKTEGIEMDELPWSGSQSLLASWKLVRRLRKFVLRNGSHDQYHLAELGSARAMVRFGWMIRKKIRLILTIHGSELLIFRKYSLESWLFKKLLLRCEKIHVLSHFNRGELLKFCPQVGEQIRLIPGAPASGLLRLKSEKKCKGNRKDFHILCVGRIHPRKGQDQLLIGLKKLPLNLQSTIVVHFAGPETKAKYFQKVRKLGNEFQGEVIFEGDCSDSKLANLYQTSDIFALTSLPLARSIEGFGFVYLEASAYGLPIVANRTGGVEDAVLHEETGLLTEPHDINSLSSLLERMINDKKLRERLGEKGQDWAKSHSWKQVAEKLYGWD